MSPETRIRILDTFLLDNPRQKEDAGGSSLSGS